MSTRTKDTGKHAEEKGAAKRSLCLWFACLGRTRSRQKPTEASHEALQIIDGRCARTELRRCPEAVLSGQKSATDASMGASCTRHSRSSGSASRNRGASSPPLQHVFERTFFSPELSGCSEDERRHSRPPPIGGHSSFPAATKPSAKTPECVSPSSPEPLLSEVSTTPSMDKARAAAQCPPVANPLADTSAPSPLLESRPHTPHAASQDLSPSISPQCAVDPSSPSSPAVDEPPAGSCTPRLCTTSELSVTVVEPKLAPTAAPFAAETTSLSSRASSIHRVNTFRHIPTRTTSSVGSTEPPIERTTTMSSIISTPRPFSAGRRAPSAGDMVVSGAPAPAENSTYAILCNTNPCFGSAISRVSRGSSHTLSRGSSLAGAPAGAGARPSGGSGGDSLSPFHAIQSTSVQSLESSGSGSSGGSQRRRARAAVVEVVKSERSESMVMTRGNVLIPKLQLGAIAPKGPSSRLTPFSDGTSSPAVNAPPLLDRQRRGFAFPAPTVSPPPSPTAGAPRPCDDSGSPALSEALLRRAGGVRSPGSVGLNRDVAGSSVGPSAHTASLRSPTSPNSVTFGAMPGLRAISSPTPPSGAPHSPATGQGLSLMESLRQRPPSIASTDGPLRDGLLRHSAPSQPSTPGLRSPVRSPIPIRPTQFDSRASAFGGRDSSSSQVPMPASNSHSPPTMSRTPTHPAPSPSVGCGSHAPSFPCPPPHTPPSRPLSPLAPPTPRGGAARPLSCLQSMEASGLSLYQTPVIHAASSISLGLNALSAEGQAQYTGDSHVPGGHPFTHSASSVALGDGSAGLRYGAPQSFGRLSNASPHGGLTATVCGASSQLLLGTAAGSQNSTADKLGGHSAVSSNLYLQGSSAQLLDHSINASGDSGMPCVLQSHHMSVGGVATSTTDFVDGPVMSSVPHTTSPSATQSSTLNRHRPSTASVSVDAAVTPRHREWLREVNVVSLSGTPRGVPPRSPRSGVERVFVSTGEGTPRASPTIAAPFMAAGSETSTRTYREDSIQRSSLGDYDERLPAMLRGGSSGRGHGRLSRDSRAPPPGKHVVSLRTSQSPQSGRSSAMWPHSGSEIFVNGGASLLSSPRSQPSPRNHDNALDAVASAVTVPSPRRRVVRNDSEYALIEDTASHAALQAAAVAVATLAPAPAASQHQ